MSRTALKRVAPGMIDSSNPAYINLASMGPDAINRALADNSEPGNVVKSDFFAVTTDWKAMYICKFADGSSAFVYAVFDNEGNLLVAKRNDWEW